MKEKTGFKKSKVSRRLSMKKTIFIFCTLLVPLYFASVANAKVLTVISGRVIAEDTGEGLAVISGRVIAEDTGEGLAGVNVQAGYLDGHRLFKVITDKNGFYILEHLKPGGYILSFYKEGDNYVDDDIPRPDFVELIKGKNLVNVNHTMKLGGSASGIVYDADGVTPLGGVGINGGIYGEILAYSHSTAITITDAGGRYELKGLPASDDCVIEVEVPGHATIRRIVSIKRGENTGNIDFIVRWDDMTGISGYVRSAIDGKPMKGAKIYLKNYSDENIGHSFTDDAGKYSIIGVPPGTYIVTAIGPGEIGSLIIKEAVVIELGKSTEVNIEFNEPAPISHFQESIWRELQVIFDESILI